MAASPTPRQTPAAADPDARAWPLGVAALRRWAADHVPEPVGVQFRAAQESPPALSPAPRWAVAFSGGADSTALLLAAHALWPGRVQALHVHHGLQASADAFATHAQAVCERLGVPCSVARVHAYPAPGGSPEDAARQARYRALADMALAEGVPQVLLAQHAQDQAETLLLALTRGAGLPGLAAMPAEFQRHGVTFGRPWLGLDGATLRQWLHEHRQPFVEDPTNTDIHYTRNRIRHRLLPALAQAFPAYADTFARSARHAAQAQRLLTELALQDLAQVGQPPVIRALQGLGRDRQANLLRFWLRTGWQAQPSEAQLNEALDQLAVCTTRGHRIELKLAQGRLWRDGELLAYTPL
jgi:tRNA(Ile)-lysidine synthase